jgi:hypothetical protein
VRLSPPLRRAALAVHLAVSVGWVGAVAAYLALDLSAATSADAAMLRAAYIGMGLIAGSVIVPLALASLVTGLIVSLGTKWGLVRHWWVLVSLALTVFATVVLLVETGTIAAYAAVAANPTVSDAELRALGSTLLHSVGGSVVLLIVLVLNVFKPPGVTPYGWRKQQEERRAARPGAPSDWPSGRSTSELGVPDRTPRRATAPRDSGHRRSEAGRTRDEV